MEQQDKDAVRRFLSACISRCVVPEKNLQVSFQFPPTFRTNLLTCQDVLRAASFCSGVSRGHSNNQRFLLRTRHITAHHRL